MNFNAIVDSNLRGKKQIKQEQLMEQLGYEHLVGNMSKIDSLDGNKSKNNNVVPNDSVQRNRIQFALNKRAKFQTGVKRSASKRNNLMRRCEEKSRNKLAVCNPYSLKPWAEHLFQALEKVEHGNVYALTLYHPNHTWEVPITKQLLEPRAGLLDRQAEYETRVRSVLRRWPFFMILDMAIHRLPRKGKYVMLPHHHGLIFGNKNEIEEALQKLSTSGIADAPTYLLRDIYYLKGWLKYICKDPRCIYVTIPPKIEGERPFHHRERMYSAHQLYMLDMYSGYTKPDLCIGSGVGSEIRELAMMLAKQRGWVSQLR